MKREIKTLRIIIAEVFSDYDVTLYKLGGENEL